MDNQHRQISGYRDLTAEEIALMNRAKALEAEVLAFHHEVLDALGRQLHGSRDERDRLQDAQAYRWAAIGRTDIETGFMALVRAIAQPQPRDPQP